MLKNIKKPKRKLTQHKNKAITACDIGDEFTAKVKDLTSSGQGVVEHPSGRICFVSGVWLGEVAKFKITDLQGRQTFAVLLDLLEPSVNRIAPACSYHGYDSYSCGGCAWMFMEYTAQLEQKQLRIETELKKASIAKQNHIIKPILASQKTLGYRNRAQFKTNGVEIGFIANGTRTLVDITHCPILCDKNQQALQDLRHSLPKPEWRPITKKDKTAWVTIDIDDQHDAVNASVNKRLPFKQANASQNIKMQCWLEKVIQTIEAPLSILELFCGSGNFTQVLLKQNPQSILAIEGQEEAVDKLQSTYSQQVCLEVACIDLYSDTGLLKAAYKLRQANVLILDPPRDGLASCNVLIEKLMHLEHIIYISCDLATFTRDAIKIKNQGFEAIDIQPVDQFVHTPHIEILAHFTRKNLKKDR